MITFQLEYTLESQRVDDFRVYAEQFVELTRKYGGEHYGYFIRSEREETKAIALFAFTDKGHYDTYRKQVLDDPQYRKAMDLVKQTQCIESCYRTIFDRRLA